MRSIRAVMKVCVALPAARPVNPRCAASYSRLICCSSCATSLLCSSIDLLLHADAFRCRGVFPSTAAMITEHPHLHFAALHDSLTRHDRLIPASSKDQLTLDGPPDRLAADYRFPPRLCLLLRVSVLKCA